jgi:hypothetical protein
MTEQSIADDEIIMGVLSRFLSPRLLPRQDRKPSLVARAPNRSYIQTRSDPIPDEIRRRELVIHGTKTI